MHGPDIPKIEVQQSMAWLQNTGSSWTSRILNKEMAKDLPAEFKIKLFPFRFSMINI